MRLLGAGVVIAFALTAFSSVANVVAGWVATAPEPGRADAIVVLGGGAEWPHGELSSTALHRTLHGIRLYKEGRAPLLVLSGGQRRKPPSEATLRSALARTCDVPAEAIITDALAHTTREEAGRVAGLQTTREEAGRVAGLLGPRGVRSILLVTDAYHMGRARRLFEHEGFAVHPAPSRDLPDPAETPQTRLALMARATQEILAAVYYRVTRRI